jgi:hypothetical protein
MKEKAGRNRVQAGIKPKGKRSAKKHFQKMCRERVVDKGLINAADGSWKSADPHVSEHRFALGGYKLIRSTKKKGEKK